MEADFEKMPGVKEVISGYTGGSGENPNYKDYGEKGHIEAVEIRTENDLDVKPYVKEKEIGWEYVELPNSFLKIRDMIKKLYDKREDMKRKGRAVLQRPPL